jgi:polyamine oxidase
MKTKVVVIGAGFSGLAAANSLRLAGCKVIVLEARNRIGGRTHASSSIGLPVDLGASWIHYQDNNPLIALSDQFGVSKTLFSDPMCTSSQANAAFFDSRLRLSQREVEKIERSIQTIQNALNMTGVSSSFEQWFSQYLAGNPLETKQPILSWLKESLGIWEGWDINQVNLSYIAEDTSTEGEQYFMSGTYAPLVEALAKDLDITLNAEVTDIDYQDEGVVISTCTESFAADAVIVTVPLSILKQLTFIPALPDSMQRSIQSLKMGLINKVILQFDDVFWPETHTLNFLQEDMFSSYYNLAALGVPSPILMTLNHGEAAVALESEPDDIIIKRALAPLTAAFPDADLRLQRYQITRWHRDKYAQGAYSYLPLGVDSAVYHALQNSIDHKVYFAGEHTAWPHIACVHGAYSSGMSAAKSLLQMHLNT